MKTEIRTVLVASAKNEGPWLVEWVAYHRALGFSNILLYQNDSNDLTDRILEHFNATGVVAYRPNLVKSGSPQMSAYKDAMRTELYRSADWCLCLDMDEFFVPQQAGNVGEFLAGYPGAEAIAVNWRNFGSSKRDRWSPDFLIQRFRRCSRSGRMMNRGYKSFHRTTAGFKSFGIHRPHSDQFRPGFIYADGETVPESVQKGANPSKMPLSHYDHGVAQLNHYSVKSAEEFSRKLLRGDGHYVDRGVLPGKFKSYDTNETTDESILRFYPAARSQYLALMSNPVLAGLHFQSCLHHFG